MAEPKNNSHRLPQIAQSRLRQQAGASADAHPDANVLSAFVEQALGGAERENVLSHLSVCADCREIVALSLPENELENASPVLKHSATSWNWGMLRWGAVAASVVVVAAAALLLKPTATLHKNEPVSEVAQLEAQPKQSNDAKVAELSAASGVVAPKAESSKQSEKDSVGETTRAERDQRSFVREPLLQQKEKKPTPGSDNGKLSASARPLQKNFRDADSVTAPVLTPPAPLTNAATQGRVLGGITPSEQPTTGKRAAAVGPGYAGGIGVGYGAGIGSGSGTNRVAQAPQKLAEAKKDDNTANKAAETETQTKDLTPSARNFKNIAPPPAADSARVPEDAAAKGPKPATEKDENARARITGATESVEVTAEAPAVQTSSSQVSHKPLVNTGSPWRIDRKGKLLSRGPDGSWHEIAFANNPRFHVLVVPKGSDEIWAGGNQGVLYHSPDMGKTWAPVQGGWPTQADIVKLKFPDALHGTLTTSQKENWITADGGKSWQKQ